MLNLIPTGIPTASFFQLFYDMNMFSCDAVNFIRQLLFLKLLG